jgi:hypothetical protein
MAQLFLKDLGPAAPLFEPVPVPVLRHGLIALIGLIMVLGMLAAFRRIGPL